MSIRNIVCRVCCTRFERLAARRATRLGQIDGGAVVVVVVIVERNEVPQRYRELGETLFAVRDNTARLSARSPSVFSTMLCAVYEDEWPDDCVCSCDHSIFYRLVTIIFYGLEYRGDMYHYRQRTIAGFASLVLRIISYSGWGELGVVRAACPCKLLRDVDLGNRQMLI